MRKANLRNFRPLWKVSTLCPHVGEVLLPSPGARRFWIQEPRDVSCLGSRQECGYLGRTEWFQNPWEGNIVWVIFWDGIRDSETVHSQVLRGEEIKYIITALGNINSEKSCISFWFKYSLQSKLPKAPWQSKLIFRRIKDLQHHILSLEQLCDDPFPNLAVKLGPVPFQNHLLCSSLPPVTQRGFGVTQPYLLCQSALPAWSAFPAGQIFLSCACWISSCPCRLPLPLPRSSAAASPWQQPRPAAWLIMQNRTVTPELYPFLSSVLILSDPASTTGAAWDSLCQGHPWLPGEPAGLCRTRLCQHIPQDTWGFGLESTDGV